MGNTATRPSQLRSAGNATLAVGSGEHCHPTLAVGVRRRRARWRRTRSKAAEIKFGPRLTGGEKPKEPSKHVFRSRSFVGGFNQASH